MKTKENFKMQFLLFVGRFYFTFIFILSFLVIALIIYLAANSKIRGLGGLWRIILALVIVSFATLKGALKALFSKIPKPEGVEIDKSEFSEIYEMIEEIQTATQCPKINHIMVDSEFNAYISEVPSIGIIAGYKRYLVIGLPLLISLSKEELKVVIAHECGHLSKAHGRSGVKIYRTKLVWENIAKEISKNKGSFIVNIFIKTYIPALNSLYYNIKKQNEFEADKISLVAASKFDFSNALLKTSMYEYLIEHKFWRDIGEFNFTQDKPVKDVFFRMETALKEPVEKDFIKSFTESLLKYRSLPCSTHPSYRERIEAVGAEWPDITIPALNALRDIFREKADKILSVCSKAWSDNVEERWKEYYSEVLDMKKRLHELEILTSKQQLTSDELLERAFIIEKLEGYDSALEAFKSVLNYYERDITARYNIGRILSYKNDEKAVDILSEVMEEDSQAIPDCCYELVNFYCYRNEKEKAAEYYHYAVDFMKTNEEVASERDTLRKSDVFLPHDLSNESIEKIREVLLKYKEIKKAYVAIKKVEISNQFPIYVIALKYKFFNRNAWKRIQNELMHSELIHWEHWFVGLSLSNKDIEYSIDQVNEARII